MIENILEQIGMLSPILVMGLGLAIGIQHAFEADHITAISTQILKSRLSKKSFHTPPYLTYSNSSPISSSSKVPYF